MDKEDKVCNKKNCKFSDFASSRAIFLVTSSGRGVVTILGASLSRFSHVTENSQPVNVVDGCGRAKQSLMLGEELKQHRVCLRGGDKRT